MRQEEIKEEANKEQRLRRQVKRKGYYLKKSRVRNRQAVCYGGYMIISPWNNSIAAGENFNLSLEDVENWVK